MCRSRYNKRVAERSIETKSTENEEYKQLILYQHTPKITQQKTFFSFTTELTAKRAQSPCTQQYDLLLLQKYWGLF